MVKQSVPSEKILKELQQRQQLPFAEAIGRERAAIARTRDLLTDLDDHEFFRIVYLVNRLPKADRREVLEFVEGYFRKPPPDQ